MLGGTGGRLTSPRLARILRGILRAKLGAERAAGVEVGDPIGVRHVGREPVGREAPDPERDRQAPREDPGEPPSEPLEEHYAGVPIAIQVVAVAEPIEAASVRRAVMTNPVVVTLTAYS